MELIAGKVYELEWRNAGYEPADALSPYTYSGRFRYLGSDAHGRLVFDFLERVDVLPLALYPERVVRAREA